MTAVSSISQLPNNMVGDGNGRELAHDVETMATNALNPV